MPWPPLSRLADHRGRSGPVDRLSDEIITHLDGRLAREQVERRLPSVAAALVGGGERVWTGFAGRSGDASDGATALDVQYRIGSITKALVAVAVLRLRDEGRLELDDPLDRHLEAPARVTIRALLAHTSGMRAESPGPWWERTAGPEADAHFSALAGHPGRTVGPGGFHYSNPGYALLGRLVTVLRARPWDEVVGEEILRPLGMHRTTRMPVAPAATGLAVHPWAPVVLPEPSHDAGAMAPAGQLWSTIGDLARFASFLASGEPAILARATLQEMARPVAVDDRPGLPWTVAHGLGLQVWNLGGRRLVGHGGLMPGFTALVRVDPEGGEGVVLVCNATHGFTSELPDDLLAMLPARVPVAPWEPTAIEPSLLALLGVWYWGTQPLVLRATAADALQLDPLTGSGRASRFRRDHDGRWFGLDAYYHGECLTVRRGPAGTVTHLDVGGFVLTRRPYDPPDVTPGGVSPLGWSTDTTR